MAKTKINIAYIGISKTATENQLHTLASTLRGMADVVTSANSVDAEKESTKKVLFGLLGITDESEVSNVVNLSNEVKAMRKACYTYYPYIQADEGESKIFLTRKSCYYSRQGTADTPTKGFYFVENIDYNNIIHTAEKSRAKGTAQKVYSLNTLYTARGVAIDMTDGYTLYSRCEDEKTGETYYKRCKQQLFEISVTPAETLKLEESITNKAEDNMGKNTQEKDNKKK